MVRTHASSTLRSPFDSIFSQSRSTTVCAHTDVVEHHLTASMLCLSLDTLAAPPKQLTCVAPKTPNKRRMLRPVQKYAAPSPAELREFAEEQAYKRMLRPWMSKLQCKDLQLLVHAVPVAERARFSELASLAMQQALPRASGWTLFDTLWAFGPDEMLGVLQLCHATQLCRLSLHKQLGVVKKLASVAAPLRAEMLACACFLLGSTRGVAAYPELLRTLAMMPYEHWPAFVTLCTPVIEQTWVSKLVRTKTVLRLARACALPKTLSTLPAETRGASLVADDNHLQDVQHIDPPLFSQAPVAWSPQNAPGIVVIDFGTHTSVNADGHDASELNNDNEAVFSTARPSVSATPQAQSSSNYRSPHAYDGENVMDRKRIGATAAAIIRLQKAVQCTLPTLAILELIQNFIQNLKSAPQKVGGHLRRRRVIDRHSSSGHCIAHKYCELENAAYVLHDEGYHAMISQRTMPHNLANSAGGAADDDYAEDTGDSSDTPLRADAYAGEDDEMLDDELDRMLADGEFDAGSPDVWSNQPYWLGHQHSIGMGDLAALIWTAIDAYEDPKQSLSEQSRAKGQMRLDFVSSLAACVEDDSHRVCQTGMAQRLLTCLQAEYFPDVLLFTPQDVLTACAREFSERFDPTQMCAQENINAFYMRSLRHAHSLFAHDVEARHSFQQHLEGYLEVEFSWRPSSERSQVSACTLLE